MTEKPELNGLMCPECGAKLFDTEPSMVLYTCPAQKRTNCEECGYQGLRNIEDRLIKERRT